MGNDVTITQKNPARRGIEFQSEGEVEGTGITIVDIVGTGHRVEKTGANKVTIYSPIVDLASYFNSDAGNNDAKVDSISTVDRYISSPTSEGTPFKIGDWVGGELRPVTQLNTWSYTTTNRCLFDSLTSTIEVKVYDADGTSLLSSKLTGAITGNYVHTSNNIRIQVSDWTPNSGKYEGVITVDVYTNLILPQGGRLSVKITHHNNSDHIKIQTPVFYDPSPVDPTIGSVTIEETIGSIFTKFLSGVEYYTTNSQFSVNVLDIDNLNQLSYPLDQVDVDGTEYGLSPLLLSGGDLTGWDSSFDNVDASYQKLDWAINVSNYSFIGNGNVQARPKNWSDFAWVLSTDSPILINTKTLTSTRLIERFEEESWRCPLTGNFDLPNQKSWDSTLDVGLGDAIFFDGGVGRIITDFTTYNPNGVNQPNYSLQDSTVYLIREFQHDGSASSNMRINIDGTYDSIEYKLADSYTGSASDGTVWVDALKLYNFGDWNNGDPLNNSGGQVNSGTGYIDVTFGSNNVINAVDGKTIYIRIGFKNNERITSLSVVFN